MDDTKLQTKQMYVQSKSVSQNEKKQLNFAKADKVKSQEITI